jgi:hypothetical protein
MSRVRRGVHAVIAIALLAAAFVVSTGAGRAAADAGGGGGLAVTGATGPGFATASPCTGDPTTSSSRNYGATDTHILLDIVGSL